MEREEKFIKEILEYLKWKLEGFYMVGGTALSLFYFKHRFSFDIDFFTRNFNFEKINRTINSLKEKFSIEILQKIEEEEKAKVIVYEVKYRDLKTKVDFIEDFFELLKPINIVNGIPVASLEDIYLRKIYAVCGFGREKDIIGKDKIVGGREEAKDFFDLYFLSSTFLPLSEFINLYPNKVVKENLIIWFRTYDRFKIKSGLVDLKTNHEIDYSLMEKHFKKEIEKIIEREVDFI